MKWFPLKKVDRYIIGEIVPPALGGLIFFIFLFLMFQTLRLAEFFIVHGIPGKTILWITMHLAISFLPMALPIAYFIGVLVAFGRLSADSELVALKASGISMGRMATPAFGLAALIVVLSLALNLEWVPWSMRNYWRAIIQIGNTKAVASLHEGAFTTGFFDLLVYAGKVDRKTNRLEQVFMYDERDPTTPMVVVGKEGRLLPVRSDSDYGTTLVLELENGNIHRVTAGSSEYQKVDYNTYRLFLDAPAGGDNSEGYKTEMHSYSRLLEKIAEAEPNSSDYFRLVVEKWKRFSIALSAIMFVWLGIGSATVKTRAPRSGAALVTLIVVLVYWSSLTWLTGKAIHGNFPPFWAVQIPNLVILLAGLLSFRRATW